MRIRERIKKYQAELNFDHKKSLGQNFLVSDHVVDKIVKAATLFAPKVIIEVGPGLGSLTEDLVNVTDRLVLIEMDRRLVEFWKEKKFEVIEADALQWPWDLSQWPRPLAFVSNLPYQISSSILIDRSIDEKPVDGMILMFQKEVAQRIQARPTDESYGFLSVMAQTFWSIDLVLEAGPRDFDPAPKVASRVLSFNPRQVQISNRKKFLKFMKSAFLQPRKYMVSNLAHGLDLPKEKVLEILAKKKVDPQIRAGQLKIQEFLELFRRFEEEDAL